MTAGPPVAAARTTYRHGDLRRALIEAGVDLARGGGPQAVVLREATRRAGVSPNAAYRHFADRAALLSAVAEWSTAALAETMHQHLAAISPALDTAGAARARLRAVGAGYIAFAQAEPGLFQTAFAAPDDGAEVHASAGAPPFELLGAALDGLVDAGALAPDRRPGAEYLAWSAVHGLAMLLIDGPLRGLPAEERDTATQHLLDMVEKGL
ncbi:TetR/AcrR family transcriptional regulator [Antrihabitans sp. YC2-6]|uniref:TetR/AcrR family transcriptional regulator n=1 Tax=Antrihabitans sp. YC2-6 TaxID=2799498 RepID=UPI0018F4B5D5|nr:TetR/AcrR family transcriptional regulator [Antrihabitans sp. YC2-6]MBJ8345549.1 TetR/AcrR family transcriptional regulator [Antrihabitans sp. YC2-6]